MSVVELSPKHTEYLTPRIEANQIFKNRIELIPTAISSGVGAPAYLYTTGNGIIFLEGALQIGPAATPNPLIFTFPSQHVSPLSQLFAVGSNLIGGSRGSQVFEMTGNGISAIDPAPVQGTFYVVDGISYISQAVRNIS